jgi:hypothetical protein
MAIARTKSLLNQEWQPPASHPDVIKIYLLATVEPAALGQGGQS